MFNEILVGPQNVSDNTPTKARGSRTGGQLVGQLHGKFAEASQRGNLFMAHAIVTAPVIYSTEAGTGGPLLWNGSSTVKANLLAVGFGITVVATVAAALGITGGGDQTAAPTSTTAIDSTTNLLIGGPASQCTAYRVGTTVENDFFMPFADVNTGALTTTPGGVKWFDIAGMITVPPNAFASVAASATATTLVVQVSLIWEEIPI